jgi:hypothetical protein
VLSLEGLHLRQQPERGKGREGRQVHRAAAAGLADLAHAGIQSVEPRSDHTQERGAVGREVDVAGAALEQRRTEFVFQALDLPADGRLRDMQFVGCLAETEPACDRLEAAQAAQRERALARGTHINSASKRFRVFIGFQSSLHRS